MTLHFCSDKNPFFSHKNAKPKSKGMRSEEHTSELQSRPHLVCRLLLEKKNKKADCHPLEEMKDLPHSPTTKTWLQQPSQLTTTPLTVPVNIAYNSTTSVIISSYNDAYD